MDETLDMIREILRLAGMNSWKDRELEDLMVEELLEAVRELGAPIGDLSAFEDYFGGPLGEA